MKLHVERRVQFWLKPEPHHNTSSHSSNAIEDDGFVDISIYIWDLGSNHCAFISNGTARIQQVECTSDTIDRSVSDAEVGQVYLYA